MDLTNDPMPDIPRLRKAVEWVEAEAARPENESEWFQWGWRHFGSEVERNCGTCYCVAGKVCEDAGLTWAPDLDDGEAASDVLADGRHAPEAASELLGLTETEATLLFRGSNGAYDVRRIAESIAARVGERL